MTDEYPAPFLTRRLDAIERKLDELLARPLPYIRYEPTAPAIPWGPPFPTYTPGPTYFVTSDGTGGLRSEVPAYTSKSFGPERVH